MKHFARLLIALSLLGCPAVAQIATTSLRGTVVDPSGAVVGGAQVSLLQPSTGFHAEHTTLANGEYSFAQIPPGSYSLKVTASGFASLAKQAELLVNQPATIDFKLSVSAQEEVEVNATAETLNTSDASLGNALNNATIEALPSEGRNVPDLLSLQPGVVYLGRQVNQDQDSRSGAVAGARSDQSNVTLDGVDNNDQTKGYAFTGILRSTLDSVEEFRVTTTSSNADSGRSSGAQVNMVTKSGTNSFHGGLYEYFRNTYFAANDWFNKQAEVASGEPNKPGTLNRNTYGAAIGGPIKTNKLFFFLNYEGQRTQENQQETMTVPTTSMRQGLISYTNAAGTNTTLTPAQFAGMDPHCSAAGTCPWGPGVDPNVLTMLNQYPMANGFTERRERDSARCIGQRGGLQLEGPGRLFRFNPERPLRLCTPAANRCRPEFGRANRGDARPRNAVDQRLDGGAVVVAPARRRWVLEPERPLARTYRRAAAGASNTNVRLTMGSLVFVVETSGAFPFKLHTSGRPATRSRPRPSSA